MIVKNSVAKKKKKLKVCTPAGVVHILSTLNNNIITLTDVHGNVIVWCSSGKSGFKGKRKAMSYAAQTASETACQEAAEMGMKAVTVISRGAGNGRDSAIRGAAKYFRILALKFRVTLPHNGTRAPKRRKV